MTYAELCRKQYKQTKASFLPKLQAHYTAQRWQDFIGLALTVYEVMPEAFSVYDEIPNELKYDFAIDAYMHHGDSVPGVRKAVRNARRYGKPKLPEEIACKDVITVYRAGEEDISKCKYRLSWTLSAEVALFFYAEYAKRHAQHVYRAQIKTADIIAYTNAREEQEVIQYRKVFDIQDITNTI